VTEASGERQPQPVRSLAEKLTWLFANVRRSNGRKHSPQEVADFVVERTGEPCSRGYITYLRNGDRDNPTKRVIEAIAAFFDISPAYFVDDEAAREIQAQLDLAVAMRVEGVRAVALRAVTTALAAGATTIPVEGLHAVHDLIRQLSGASAPAPQDTQHDTEDPATFRNGHRPG
jgi:ESX-1-secreted protein regulator